MQAVIEYFTNAVASFPQYPRWLYFVTVVGVILLTEAVKLPIKHFTKKLTNEKTRRLINISIMLVPFILSFVCGVVYKFMLSAEFSTLACLSWATSSMIIYEFGERIIDRIRKGEKITDETVTEDFNEAKKEVEDTTKNVAKSVKQADEEFQKQVNKYTTKKGSK